MTFDLTAFLARQAEHSERNFGPGQKWEGVVAHIRKELAEIEKDPTDAVEWIDVVLLALDGARRAAGLTPEQIIETLVTKQTKNEHRIWPDWRTLGDGVPIEHVREGDLAIPLGTRVRWSSHGRAIIASTSPEHYAEFQYCEGVIIGKMFDAFDAPELDVRWQPSNLRYGYHPDHLERV